MAPFWRLYRTRHGPGLDGIGGMFAEGRWHTLGEPVVHFGGSAAIVSVPSAILPEERKFVLNPGHPDAKLMRLVRKRRFAFDSRLI